MNAAEVLLGPARARIADRHTIIEKGRVAWSGSSAELGGADDVKHRYLGV